MARKTREAKKMTQQNNPHNYIKANLGHSDLVCAYCHGTPMENIAIGEANHCDQAPQSEALNKD